MAIISVPLLITAGVISIAGVLGLVTISWSLESVEEIVEDTKVGSTVLLFGLGILALAFGAGKLFRTFK